MISERGAAQTYAWETTLSVQREKIVDAIRSSTAFDSTVLSAFDQSRQPDGTYLIHPNDPILIQNSKSLINLLQSLEKMMPAVFEPLASYVRADGFIDSGFAKLGVFYNIGTNLSDIKTFTNDIWYLSYYLKQLQSTIAGLPALDKSFLPLLSTLNNIIASNIEPALNQFKLLQQNEDEAPEIVNAIETLQNVTSNSQNEEVTQDSVALGSETMNSVYQQIGQIKDKINDVIFSKGFAPDPETGLYPETENGALNNLIHSANALTRFEMALKKIDNTINRRGIYAIDVLREIGHAFQALQEIKFNSGSDAQALMETIGQVLEGINPILMQMARFMEITEHRLGLRNEALLEQFRQICESYKILATTAGVELKLKQQYPYWEERLDVRRRELERKQTEYKEMESIKKALTDTTISENTPLRELLHLKDTVRKVKSADMYYYETGVDKLIRYKTGTKQLSVDIKQLENKITAANGNNKDDLIKLKNLYRLKHELENKIQQVIRDPTASDNFSYDRATSSIISKHQPIDKKLLVTNEKKQIAINTVNIIAESALKKSQEYIELVKEAQDQVIQQKLYNPSAKSSPAIENSLSLKEKVAAIHPMAIFTMPLTELHALSSQLKSIKAPEIEAFTKILDTAILERAGLNQLTEKQKTLNQDRRALNTSINIVSRNQDQISSNKKTITTLKKYKEILAKNTNAELSKNMAENIENKLGLEPGKAQELFSSNQTWTGWATNSVLGNPLINAIDQKISHLENETEQLNNEITFFGDLNQLVTQDEQLQMTLNQTTQQLNEVKEALADPAKLDHLPPHQYSGTALSTWQAAQSTAIQALNNKILDSLPRQRSARVPVSTPTEQIKQKNIAPFKEESDQQLVERLQKEKQGSFSLKIQSLREKLASMVKPPYFDDEQAKILKDSLQSNGKYTISPSDSIILKNIKSLANTLTQIDSLSSTIQTQYGSVMLEPNWQSYLQAGTSGLSGIKTQINQLQSELTQLNYHLGTLQNELNQFPEITNSPAMNDLFEFARPAIELANEWLSLPNISTLSGENITKLTNDALLNLHSLSETNTNALSPLKNFSPLEKSINSLTNYLKEKNIHREDKKTFKMNAANSQETRNVIMLTNLLISLQRSTKGMMKISQDNTLAGTTNVLTGLTQIYSVIKELRKSEVPEIQSAIQETILQIHPILIQLTLVAENLEQKIGVKPILQDYDLNKELQKICQKFESTAQNMNIALSSHYPYFIEKRVLALKELRQQQETLDSLKNLDRQISLGQLSGFHNLSLSELVTIRNSLGLISPTPSLQRFAKDINLMIAEKTGLVHLENDIGNTKNTLKNLERKITTEQTIAKTIVHEIEQLQQSLQKLTEIDAKWSTQPLSMQDIAYLHGLYSVKNPISLEKFTQHLANQNDMIHQFIKDEIANTHQQIDEKNKKLSGHQTEINRLNTLFNEHEIQFSRLTSIADDLNQRISEQPQQTFVYDPAQKQIVNRAHLAVTIEVEFSDPVAKEIKENLVAIENKVSHLENRIKETDSMQMQKVQVSLKEHQQKLSQIESTLGFSKGTFSNNIIDPANKDVIDLTKKASSLNNISGIFKHIISNNKRSTNASRYQNIILNGKDEKKILQAVQQESVKRSAPLGRFFRKLFGNPSLDDQLHDLSKHFLNKTNFKKYFGKQEGIDSVSQTKNIMMELSNQDLGTAKHSLQSPRSMNDTKEQTQTNLKRPAETASETVTAEHASEHNETSDFRPKR